MTTALDQLRTDIAPLREKIIQHPLFLSLHGLPAMHRFMEHHVAAVWDFMTLLKSLQHQLTGIDIPWVPSSDPTSRRMINEIVLAEESDIDPNGTATSHFELYLNAMSLAGASTTAMTELIQNIQDGQNLPVAILTLQTQTPAAAAFILDTWRIVTDHPLHDQAAVFAFGRENLIPDMFTEIVRNLGTQFPDKLAGFQYYLQRHIELDQDEHGPLALRMVTQLCGEDPEKWASATAAVKGALRSRLALWDGAFTPPPPQSPQFQPTHL